MSKMKALIISVGTGTCATKQAVENLVNAITFSIKHHNPNKAKNNSPQNPTKNKAQTIRNNKTFT